MSALAFTLTAAHEASAPPRELDEVRLLVARPGRPLVHDMFRGLPSHLRAGDESFPYSSTRRSAVKSSASLPGSAFSAKRESPLAMPAMQIVLVQISHSAA